MLKKYMVIDVGGTAIKYALMDEEFHFLKKGEVPTPYTNLEEYLHTLTELVEPYKEEISGAAFSMPGQIDARRGYLFSGGSLDNFVHEYPMGEELRRRLGCPVSIENDAKCAGLAEVSQGALQGCRDAMVIVLGTGVGGAIIKDGKIHSGSRFSAGEVSFLLVTDELDDPTCLWGFRGGNRHMIQEVSKVLQVPQEELDGRKIFAMAEKGNEQVIEVLRKHFRDIAVQIYNLQVIFDPERIAIGGGISANPLTLQWIQDGLDEIYEKAVRTVYPVELVACHFRSDANLIGALSHHLSVF